MDIYQDHVSKESRLTHVPGLIEAIMGDHSHEVDKKRERLQTALVQESESYYEELERQKQIQADAFFEDRKKRALSSLVQVEAEKKGIAERQIELYSRQNNEDLKINESMQKCWEAAAYNKLKIEERKKVKRTRNQMDLTLDVLLQQMNLKQIEEEDKIARRRRENFLHECNILKNQIIEKRLKTEERILSDIEDYEHLKQSAKEYEEDEKREIMKKLMEKQDIAKEKHENMIQSIEKRKENDTFEKEFSKHYCQAQLMNSTVQPSCSKAQLKLEQDLFLETQLHFKEEMRKAESHADELRKLENSRQEKHERETQSQEQMKKRKRYQDIIKTQIMQIMASTKLGSE